MDYLLALRNIKTMLRPDGKLLPMLELILVGTKIGYGLAKDENGKLHPSKGIEVERIVVSLEIGHIDQLIEHLQNCKQEMQIFSDAVAGVQIQVPKSE